MKFTIALKNLKTIDKIEGYWNNQDYINLLERFDFDGAAGLPEADLLDMLFMAITDFEPDEAAKVVLAYKLGDVLNQGQLSNISHEMLVDKIAEEYSDISLHYPLFNINQLLYQAFNGKFPKTLASLIDIELSFEGKVEVTKEVILRCLSDLLSKNSLLKRLYNDQLDATAELTDANSIIWELNATGENTYQLISSDYWLNREDFELTQCSGTLREEEINHE